MATENNHKDVWFTNQECEVAGTYVANHCGIRFEINFQTGNKFVRCPACGQDVEWTLTDRH
jgi:transcription initiation factor IIE alpha subunit